MGDCWNWEIHRKINLDDLWAQHGHEVLGLPAPLMPELPVLSKNDPDVLCGVLREDGFSGRTWIIYADLKQLSVLSCVLYINELIVHQRDAIDNEEYNNLLPFVPWLRSDIPRYLNQPQDVLDDTDYENHFSDRLIRPCFPGHCLLQIPDN
ncbi:hypothetical protein C2845_PM08G27390 [Panicum miliaceum]|uniref:Uncharacterized protein n=1 Tax=Panicum miliaceum TaxID=4540 RepID=A0A3L6QYD1_PANMI|nr:hypothetical protein C2845_PM08G27390 [Panicum miliaceum]